MIECMNVYKRYPTGTNALYDINVKVDQGEFIYIIGPTGSGKSTLIKLLDGEEKATKGKVKVVGIDVGTLRRSQIPIYRRNIGVVPGIGFLPLGSKNDDQYHGGHDDCGTEGADQDNQLLSVSRGLWCGRNGSGFFRLVSVVL